MLVLSGCVAAVLAYTGDTAWAVVLTTVAAAITSWSEFSDVSRKTERYNRALVELANLRSGWFDRMCLQGSLLVAVAPANVRAVL